MTFRPATEPRPVPFPRWLVLTPAEPHEKLAVLTGKLKPRQAKNMATTIATATDQQVIVVEERRGASNPTLVHHGLARGAAFHITSTLSGPIADVFGSSPMVARAIAQLVSNAIGEQVEVTRNTLVGKGSVHSRVDTRQPRGRSPMPSRNPSGDPKPGEVWTTLAGAKFRVVSVTSSSMQVLNLDTGNRERIARAEFFATLRAPRIRTNPSPRIVVGGYWQRNSHPQHIARVVKKAAAGGGMPATVDLEIVTGRGQVVGVSNRLPVNHFLAEYSYLPNDSPYWPDLNKADAVRWGGRNPNPKGPKAGRKQSRSRRGGRARRTANPSGELQRAKRTALMWNEFEATGSRRVKVRSRAIPKHLVKLGDLDSVVYRSKKYGGKPKLYEHRFKRPLPVLASDPDGRAMHIVGGGYKITGDGLVD